ncbi:MAG: dipeptidase [Actinomycetia bacterium]|nr:dipeptidase [Actinomycetes bacterium]
MNELDRQAHRIHASMPVVDGHNDLPWAIRIRAAGDLSRADPSRPLEGYHTDGPRLRTGGVGAQFWSVYVPAWQDEPFRAVIDQIDLVGAIVENDPDHLVAASNAEAARQVAAGGRTASLLGAEGGHAIENDLAKLEALCDRGVRYMTLTHSDSIDWADSATDVARNGGLTEFGRSVVSMMNELGMVVDISHVSDATMRDAIEVSDRPVMASHSGARSIASHVRNVPDDVLEAVAENGGVVMVNFYPSFVVDASAREMAEMFAEARELRPTFDSEADFDRAMNERRGAMNLDKGTVRDVVDHIDHIRSVAGIDHVGLGSDFDGIDSTPVGLEDVSRYPAITRELLDRGWSEPDVRMVLGLNALRVLADNE